MWTRVSRAWRLLATALCFTVFGVGGVLLALVSFPLLRLFVHPASARKQAGQRLLSASFTLFVAFMRATGVMAFRVHGRERLAQPGCIVVANHPSLIDVVLLIALMPRVDCIVKEQLWHNPITRGPLRVAGYISNRGGPELIEQCRESLANGNRLIVFPEGTRTRPGEPLALQRGAANIAVHTGADVLPVTILLSESTLTKVHRWYHIPRRRVRITMTVDEPFRAQPYLEQCGGAPLAARKLTEDLRHYYVTRLAQADSLPEHEQPPGTAGHG